MALREEFEASGNWLFRLRSFVPLLLFIPLLLEMRRLELPLHSQLLQDMWEFVCVVVSFSGLALRCLTTGHTPVRTSGRNTHRQVAESLNTTGMYSIVRHPLYLANYVMWLGFAMFCLEWRLIALFSLTFWIYYERIMFAEEEFLRKKFGQPFLDWAAGTPAFLPRFAQWRPPALPFSLKTVLRREYSGFFGVIVVFFTLNLLEHLVIENKLVFGAGYIALGAIGGVVYLALRSLKKQTKFLQVEGR